MEPMRGGNMSRYLCRKRERLQSRFERARKRFIVAATRDRKISAAQ
jgi:hypothetical protein